MSPRTKDERRSAKAAKRATTKAPLTHKVIIKRGIVIIVILAITAAVFYAVFFTQVLNPLWDQVPQVQAAIDWVSSDPSRLFIVATMLLFPYLGLYQLITGREL